MRTRRKIGLISITVIMGLLIIMASLFFYSRSWSIGLFLKPLSIIDTNSKIVALTFDDGPSQNRTPKLLKLLNDYNIKATFFMLGESIEKYPDIASQVYENGHLIGNHSYSHPRMIFTTISIIRNEIKQTDALISRTGQNEIRFFRPPYSSKYILLPLILKQMKKQLVTGTYDPPAEYKNPLNAQAVSAQVINNVKPGSIIYLHDGLDSYPDEFIETVKMIIEGLQERNYSFVKLNYIE